MHSFLHFCAVFIVTLRWKCIKQGKWRPYGDAPISFKVTYKVGGKRKKKHINFLNKNKSSLIMSLSDPKWQMVVWSASWLNYHKGQQILHKTFISLTLPLLITTLIAAGWRLPSNPNVSGYWIRLFFCRLKARKKIRRRTGVGQRQKGNNTARMEINSRSSGVMKTDIRWDEGWGTSLYCWWTPPIHQSFTRNVAHSSHAQLHFNAQWNWWLCEWDAFQR